MRPLPAGRAVLFTDDTGTESEAADTPPATWLVSAGAGAVDLGAVAATRGSAEEEEEEGEGTTSSSLSLTSSITTALKRPAAPPCSFWGRAVAEDAGAG